ncbi:unnamed protein product [Peronospora belbahrii]|uniref:RNA polymerase II-associated protein 3 n=1 Tax=Peronospora belbahrii TaxID=622444 RepID=A0ABN8D1R6_9STRA|nr:unnamed protein product [Peronospora belbahrii]
MDATNKEATAFAPIQTQELLEKEEGNEHYKRGDYVAAIESYTRCLSHNRNDAVVLSNRAMAYIKNQEFGNAEDDCTLALKIDPTHIKSYTRRGTARNFMGKHRLALLDFDRAATLNPNSRQIQSQLQSTRELIRAAIKGSPKRLDFLTEIVGERSHVDRKSQQDCVASENMKDLGSQQLAELSPGTEQQLLSRHESAYLSLPQEATPLHKTRAKGTTKSLTALPKLPKKPPATSYEFSRVWKTLDLRGDTEQNNRLLKLRADYLLMIDPLSLCSIFKTSIESDVLHEIFHVLRYAVLDVSETNSLLSTDTATFVLAFIVELAKVPRFNMTVMLLSESEKEDVAWVVKYLEAHVKESSAIEEHHVGNLNKMYELL